MTNLPRGLSTRHAKEESELNCMFHDANPRVVVCTPEAKQADILDFESVACSLEVYMPLTLFQLSPSVKTETGSKVEP